MSGYIIPYNNKSKKLRCLCCIEFIRANTKLFMAAYIFRTIKARSSTLYKRLLSLSSFDIYLFNIYYSHFIKRLSAKYPDYLDAFSLTDIFNIVN